jgi:hypothetical protein
VDTKEKDSEKKLIWWQTSIQRTLGKRKIFDPNPTLDDKCKEYKKQVKRNMMKMIWL